MSVSDPLIKDIKAITIKLFNEGQNNEITDNNQNLLKFCTYLEEVYYKGTQNQQISGFYNTKKYDVFNWMQGVAQDKNDVSNFSYRSNVDLVKGCKNVQTPLGRFRLLIRCCLVNKCIHTPLEFLINNKEHLRFYMKHSILGDEILSKILLSVLLNCNKIAFKLDLKNCSFLDTTWQLPEILRFELVPCRNLGISVSFSDNKAVIVNVQEHSVAAETGQIFRGDVLDNINGVLIDSSSKGRLNSILNANKKRPVQLIIIKAFYRSSKTIFPPIKRLLFDLKIDVEALHGNETNESIKQKEQKLCIKTGFKATYLGSVNVGSKGSVKQVEEALRYLLGPNKKNDEVLSIPVVFEIGEMNVKVFKSSEMSEVLLKHSYMQISSCGSGNNLSNYFGYIAGEETCDNASKFTCYIFHVLNIEDGYKILQGIGQGFYRTHFAV